jgi:predicted metal-binding membrane protein
VASVPTGIRAAYLRLTAAYGPVPLGVLASLIVATAAAWALTLHHALTMSAPMSATMGGGMTTDGMDGMESMVMGGMPAGGWSVSALAAFLAVWTVMMTAMMLPAIAPMVLIFASAQARRAKSIAVPTWIFIAGYVLVWVGAGLVVYALVQMSTDLLGRPETVGRDMWGHVALGATLVLAGLYQLSPAKHVCLRHCRSPLAFVAQYWREGWTGAFGMGIRHGLYCLGCCWALFAVLLALGMMSIAWMLLITLVVFGEKVLPHGQHAATAIGIVLATLGVVVAGAGVSSL